MGGGGGSVRGDLGEWGEGGTWGAGSECGGRGGECDILDSVCPGGVGRGCAVGIRCAGEQSVGEASWKVSLFVPPVVASLPICVSLLPAIISLPEIDRLPLALSESTLRLVGTRSERDAALLLEEERSGRDDVLRLEEDERESDGEV